MSSEVDSTGAIAKEVPVMAAADTAAAAAGPADPQQRLVTLCRQHAEHLEDNKQLQSAVRKLKHRADQLQRETSGMEAEHARTLLTRSQLEALCRELQAQNRAIKEESQVKVREEGEKRRAVAAQFQTTLSDISGMIADGSQKNAQLTEENANIANKLSQLCQQYEQKNAVVAEMIRQKELKSRLSDAEFAKIQVDMRKERGKFAEEKQKLQQAVAAQRSRYTALQAADAQLKAELETYSKRFDEIQEALAKSEVAFDTYKTDMAKMHRTVGRLEKESSSWRQKCAANNQALLRLTEQKQADNVLLATQQRRLDTLLRLCRAMESRPGVSTRRSSCQSAADSSSETAAVSSSAPGTRPDPPPVRPADRDGAPLKPASDGPERPQEQGSNGGGHVPAESSNEGEAPPDQCSNEEASSDQGSNCVGDVPSSNGDSAVPVPSSTGEDKAPSESSHGEDDRRVESSSGAAPPVESSSCTESASGAP